MSPFGFVDYRSYLNAACDGVPTRGLKAQMAKAAGCQASYLSQALRGRVHLTEDQLLGIAQSLELSPMETELLLLLLRVEKAATPPLRSFLAGAVQKLRTSHAQLSARVRADETATTAEHLGQYFATWIPSVVHALTSSPDTQTPESIAARLRLPLRKIKETLRFLAQAGFVRHEAGRWHYERGSLHIPKDSPWQAAVQASRRELAARSIALNPPEALHFSSIFTLDQRDFEKVKDFTAKLIEKSHDVIKESGTSRLACVCFDVFEVV